MQSQLFPSARASFLSGTLNWLTGNVKALLLADSYVPSFAEVNLSDIPSNVIVATSANITARTATNGNAGGTSANLGVILSTTVCSKAILFLDTGTPATSKLILFIGDEGLVTLPFAPLGLEYYIYPDALSGGYFRI